MKREIILAVALGILSGCTMGPDFHEPEVCAPCVWTNPHIDMQEPAVKWWEELNDETLTYLIEQTIACNWDLKKAMSSILQARASLREVNSLFWPTLGTMADVTGMHLPRDNFFLSPETDFAFYDVSFDGIWELDLFGKIRRLSEASRANERMKCEEARGLMVTLIAETATDYMHFRGLQAQEEFLYQMLNLQKDSYELTKCLRDQGILGDGKLLEMQGSVRDVEAKIDSLRATKQSYIMSLGILTSLWPSDISSLLETVTELPLVSSSPKPGSPFSLLRRRPDIRAAEENLHVASAQIGAAIASFYPSIDLWGLLGQSSLQLSDLFEAANRSAVYGGIVSIPLFNGGQLLGHLQLQEAKEKEAWAIYSKTVLKAVSEVDASIAMEQSQHNRFIHIQETAEAKRILYDFARQFYEKGITSALQLNAEEQIWLTAQTQVIQAHVDWMQSWISSYKAFGGGWQ